MRIHRYPEEKELLNQKLSRRKKLYDRSLIQSVTDIFKQVAESGDEAILHLTEKFDHVKLDTLRISEEYIRKCVVQIPDELVRAIHHARINIGGQNGCLPKAHENREDSGGYRHR